VIELHRLKTWSRDIAPWVVAAVGIQMGLHVVWPAQFAAAGADRERAGRLRTVVPDAHVLQRRVDSLLTDSVRLGRLLERAESRQIAGSDPAASLAASVVPLVGAQGWKLDRVKADASGGFATLDLGASTTFSSALEGLREIRRLPLSIKVRKLSMRPNPSGRLSVDLQIAVPTRESP
jgi:hypothetical protein